MVTKASNISTEDAQEMLASAQLIGEGWYRQVALAIKMGAPKALGMERREFARAIGHKMIDPRDAIVELHRTGSNMNEIADILAMDSRDVHNALVTAGEIEGPKRKRGTTGNAGPADGTGTGNAGPADNSDNDPADEIAELEDAIEALEAQVKGEQAKRRAEAKALREEIAHYAHEKTEAVRKARAEANAKLTEKERERARKEAEAWAAEISRKTLAGLSHLVTGHVVSAIEEATEGVQEIVRQDAVDPAGMSEIEAAMAALGTEIAMAKMLVKSEGK